jgi:hypothetical protein
MPSFYFAEFHARLERNPGIDFDRLPSIKVLDAKSFILSSLNSPNQNQGFTGLIERDVGDGT